MLQKALISITITILAYSSSFTQEVEVPKIYSFATEEQCIKFEKNVSELIDWLAENPIDSNEVKRKNALLFIKQWGKETPTMLLCPYTKISTPIFKDLKNKDKRKRYGIELYMSYVNGMIKSVLEKPMSTDIKKIQLAGIESLIDFYNKNHKIIYDSKSVATYMKLKNKGELEAWVEKRLTTKLVERYKEFLAGNLEKENLESRDFDFD